MRIARARRAALTAGEAWPHVVPHKEVVKAVPFKGHLRDERKLLRAAEVERCMALMPGLVAEYREERKVAKRARRHEKLGIGEVLRETRGRMEGVYLRGKGGKGGKGGKK